MFVVIERLPLSLAVASFSLAHEVQDGKEKDDAAETVLRKGLVRGAVLERLNVDNLQAQGD